MDIGVLKEYMTLAIVRNFSEAARLLNMSQPTLSRHIASLESELRCTLIDRKTPLELTRAGELLLNDVQTMLATYDSMLETARVATRNPQEVVSVQDYSFAQKIFERVSACERACEDEFSGVTFRNVECASGQTIFELVDKGSLDVGFVHTFDDGTALQDPKAPDFAETRLLPLLCGSLAFVYHKDGHIAEMKRRGGMKSLSDFASVEFLSPTERYLDAFRDNFTRFCVLHGGFKPRFDFRVMHSHKYFYSLNPGDSAYIAVGPQGPNRLAASLAAMNEDLEASVFEQYRFNTSAVFSRDRASEAVDSFVRRLAEGDA